MTAVSDTGLEPLPSLRGGYTITMREDAGTQDVLRAVGARIHDDPPQGVHVGWGSFRNLDIVAAWRAPYALVFDVNPHQLAVWRAVRRVLPEAATPDAFAGALASALPATPRPRRFVEDLRTWIASDGARPGSWLSDPASYAHVRSLAQREALGVGVLDLRGPVSSFEGVAARLAAQRLTPQTLYVSNLPWLFARSTGLFDERLPPDARSRMAENLSVLAAPDIPVVFAERLEPRSADGDPWFVTEVASLSVVAQRWGPGP